MISGREHFTVYKYLFGPVPSRRLGRSLGIDLVPLKTCSFNCIFCQAGHTTNLTSGRREYVPIEDVLVEFDSWLKSGGVADYITFSGSGEPTLNSRIGDMISAIREKTDTRIALLTNGSLLHLPEVRDEISQVHLIKASLSAWDNDTMDRINRPVVSGNIDSIINGIRDLRQQFGGELWIEVFLVDGVNDDMAGMRKIAGVLRDIKPDRIQLNTVVRPPAESSARPLNAARLENIAALFTPCGEVIAQTQPAPLADQIGVRPVM